MSTGQSPNQEVAEQPTSSAENMQSPGLSAVRMAHLKPPAQLDFEAKELSHTWKKWKEEIELYMDLMMSDRDDQTKVKMFLYLIGSQGREIYKTMPFARPQSERTLLEVIEAFDGHCDPRKSETVERYKFFSRVQEAGEPLEKFITEIRLLAATCNFADLKDSLVRDRIVCGIQDKQLREDLLKEYSLDLEKCLRMCRAADLSKERSKAIDARERINAVSAKQSKQRFARAAEPKKSPTNTMNGRKSKDCYYCGRKHEPTKERCPAYGKKCSSCGKMNHFAAQCKTSAKINSLETESSDSEDEEYCLTLEAVGEEVLAMTGQSHPKKLFATIHVEKKPVKFQLDTGATCNIMPATFLGSNVKIKKSGKTLTMYNNTTVTPLGQCVMRLFNPKNSKTYQAEFVVVDDAKCTPILGSLTIQDMDLLKVQHQNIMSIDTTVPLTKEAVREEYPDVFAGTGKLAGTYKLEVDNSTKPVVHPPRRVPVALQEPLKKELGRLQELGIIAKVTEPTPWVSSMVTVRKSSGKLRVCLDPKDLNKAIKRSHYPTPTIDDILPRLGRARVFSTLDVKNGFWHVELDEESSCLTTFNSPLGRFRWCRLPFGLSSAPEVFQRRLNQALEGLAGALPIHDDILVYGEGDTIAEATRDHDRHLHALLQRCREQNLKLNWEKVRLRCKEVPFMGHVIAEGGLKADPEKIQAVVEMPTPTDVAAVRRFMGFVNYLSKFLPRLSDVCEPLRNLTVKNVEWFWTDVHDKAVQQVKRLVTCAPVLRYFDAAKSVTLQCDASEKGLGAVLTQDGQPIAYASRALTDPETRYAQIEKELLAVVYGLEKFHTYTYGRLVIVESDHKPLEVIFKKALHQAPKRLQRMLMRTQGYTIDLGYRKGSTMYLADTLSRAYLPCSGNSELASEIESINMLQDVQIKSATLREIKQATQKDEALQELIKVIEQGWPENKASVPQHAAPYFDIRDELSVYDGMAIRGDRVIVPQSLRHDMLHRLHYAHNGIVGCLSRARESLYWPGMTSHIKDFIGKCDVCRSFDDRQPKETMVPHEVPDRPWAKVGADLFTYKGQEYLVAVDYYSTFWEVDLMTSTTSSAVIRKLKVHFARHGIPDQVISDNGPQFDSQEFQDFSKEWKFEHITTSPYYSQSNGEVEAAVKSAKKIMKKARKGRRDPHLALLEHRNIPTQGLDTSPVQRLMSRRTRTLVPSMPSLLKPACTENTHKKIMKNKERQMFYYNKSAKDLKPLKEGDTVRIRPPGDNKEAKKATVNKQVGIRSFEVVTEDGARYRRNRRHLRKTVDTGHNHTAERQARSLETPPVMSASEAMGSAASNETAITPASAEAELCPTPTPLDQGEAATGPPAAQRRSGRTVKPPSYLEDYVTSLK